MNPISVDQATAMGYVPLTDPYDVKRPAEAEMLERAVKQLRKPYVLVKIPFNPKTPTMPGGIEIWVPNGEIKIQTNKASNSAKVNGVGPRAFINTRLQGVFR